MPARTLPIRIAFLLWLVATLAGPALATPVVAVRRIKESKPKVCTVDVQVPQIQNPTDAQKRINEHLLKEARFEVRRFESEAAKAHPEDPAVWDLTLQYSLKHLDDRWYSFEIRGGEYTGGAHPSPILVTHLFDLQSGREVELADLFLPNTPFLKTLAETARRTLSASTDEMLSDKDWIKRGTEPTHDNYQLFFIDGHNLVLMFGQYQVAPYAAGSQEVKIPYGDLSAIARPGGPLRP